MKTTVDKLSNTRVKLTITVTPDELKPSLDKAYQTIAKQVQVPGFRKGKVPSQIIDQRVGREAVIDQAVSEGIDEWYRQAVVENEINVMGQPSADVTSVPDAKTGKGDVVVEIEVDVRPDFELPKYDGVKVEVEAAKVDDEAIEAELDALRARFGTLKTVERPAKKGDFVTIDLVAKIDEEIVDEADGISYEIGSGELIDGIDEALETLTEGEETTFSSKLLGGAREGQDAEITVKVTSVKERELPEVDEDFVQMASEFDTVDELKADLAKKAEERAVMMQVGEARTKLVEQLVEAANIELPDSAVDDEVNRHLEQEGKQPDDPHGDEVRENTLKAFREQLLLDAIVKAENVQIRQDELTSYLISMSQQYGMAPQEFVNILQQNGQLPAMAGEVARNKAATILIDRAEVVDSNGKKVDVTSITGPILAEPEAPAEAAEAAGDDAEGVAAQTADEQDATAKPAAKKPAAKKPATKKPAAKQADAGEAAEAADEKPAKAKKAKAGDADKA